jgi:hypothetical protein
MKVPSPFESYSDSKQCQQVSLQDFFLLLIFVCHIFVLKVVCNVKAPLETIRTELVELTAHLDAIIGTALHVFTRSITSPEYVLVL